MESLGASEAVSHPSADGNTEILSTMSTIALLSKAIFKSTKKNMIPFCVVCVMILASGSTGVFDLPSK